MKRIALTLLLLFTASVQAGGNSAYFGGGYSLATIDAKELDLEFNLSALDVAGGFMFTEYLGLEARIGLGVSDDVKRTQVSVLEPEAVTKLNRYYGFYLRPQYSTGNFQFYGLAGYTGAEVEINITDTQLYQSGEDSGPSYGVGAGFSPDGVVFFNLEYQRLITADLYDFSAINLRVEFKM